MALDLTGDRALMRNLDRLSKKVGKAVLRKAMREGAEPIIARAKELVPVKSKRLKRSIGKRFKWYGGTGTDVAVIGPRISYKTERNALGKRVLVRDAEGHRISVHAGQHGYILEYGTGPRYTKEGVYRGIGPPRPYMRPAWSSEKNKAEALAVARLRKEVDKEARRGG